jgi:predicted nucleotidyltransferase
MYGLPDYAIAKINTVFASYRAIEKVILYGSRAKGNYKNGSDIDLTIMGDITFTELLRIETIIDDLLLPWMIDLSVYPSISNQDLREHIDRVGKIFYER